MWQEAKWEVTIYFPHEVTMRVFSEFSGSHRDERDTHVVWIEELLSPGSCFSELVSIWWQDFCNFGKLRKWGILGENSPWQWVIGKSVFASFFFTSSFFPSPHTSYPPRGKILLYHTTPKCRIFTQCLRGGDSELSLLTLWVHMNLSFG